MAGSNNNSKSLFPKSIPLDLKTYTNEIDSLITRLNAVLKTPGGLTAFLGTANYTLYILAHLHTTAPSRARVIELISRLIGRTPSKAPAGALNPTPAISPITPLALVIGETRTTLRLLGLVPMYVMLKSLIKSRNDPSRDPILHSIAIAQACGYIGFQALENIYHLNNKTIIATSQYFTSRFGIKDNARLMTLACRSWLVAISCEFLRLIREAQISKNKADQSEKEQRERDAKWWGEFMIACSWLPMALHYSIDGGIGLNLGLVGLSGFGAYFPKFLEVWRSTKA